MNDPQSRHRPPPSHRLLDLFVLVAAAWTVLCNVLVLAGADFRALLWLSPLALLGGLAAWSWCRRRTGAPPAVAVIEPSPTATRWWRRGLVVQGVFALALLLHGPFGPALVGVWAALVVYFLLAHALSRVQPGDTDAEPHPGERWLWLLALAAGLFSGFVHRVSLDDALYLNFAVGALEDPSRALLRFDTLHEHTDLPLLFSMYRMHSIELGGAALARLTGLSVLTIFQLGFPVGFSILGTLAYARLQRLLAPRTWLLATLATLTILATCAQVSKTFETHFLRLAQGKSLVLVVFLPLTIVYAARFARAPSWARWILLMAVQISAAGASANGSWVLPTVAVLSLLGSLPGRCWSMASLRRLLLGCLASSYVLAIVAIHLAAQPPRLLRGGRMPSVVLERAVSADPRAVAYGQEVIHEAWQLMFQDGLRSMAAWGTLLLAVWCCRLPRARRLTSMLPLGLLLLFLNPFIASVLCSSLLGRNVYVRVLWILPWPALAALVLTAPARWLPRPRGLGVSASLALLAAYVTFVPSPHIFREETVYFGFGRLAVPEDALAAARLLQENTPKGKTVLAADQVATWLVCLEDHPRPIACRPVYLEFLNRYLEPEEVQLRKDLLDLVSGRTPDQSPRILRQGLKRYSLGGVCLDDRVRLQDPPRWSRLIAALEEAGLRRVERTGSYHVWCLPGAD